MRTLLAFLVITACLIPAQAEAQELNFNLPDLDGNPVKLEKQDDDQFTVVCFLGAECPLANLYAPRINQLAVELKKVRFIGICSNQQDSLEDLRTYRNKHQLRFPLVQDRHNVVADQFNAQRTPEVFLLDRGLKIQYHGRIDDQYFPGIAKPKPDRHDLQIAINECLSQIPVSIAATEPEGCLIGRVKEGTQPASNITYANQISRILQHHCSECHRAGQIGPMELTQYEEVAGWANMIVEVIDDHRMPPWHADPNYGEFINERRITTAERQMVRDWVAAGMPKGDLSELIPKRQVDNPTNWRLPREPDLVVSMRSNPFDVPAAGVVEYQYFVVDPGFSEDKWVTAAEILPGDRSVLHHSIVFVRPPDGTEMSGIGWLAAYVPGQSAPSYNPLFGRKIPAGSRFVFQQHYTPNGKPATDTTKIGLIFGNEQEIENEVLTLLALDQEFVIPPGVEDHPVRAKFQRLPQQGILLGIAPHMHYRGKTFELTADVFNDDVATGAAGTSRRTLLLVPNYDFNWQPIYQFRDPIPLDSIKSMEFVATFDNSEKNRANPDPTRQVIWGDQTWEEMAVAFAIVSQPRAVKRKRSRILTASQKQALEKRQVLLRHKVNKFVDAYFQRFDANSDGRINSSELPRSVRDHGVMQIDDNGDRIITREEVTRAAGLHFENTLPHEPTVD